MGHVIAIFGTLIALNLGFGYWLSEQSDVAEPEQGVVEVEEVVPADQAVEAPAEDK